MKPKYVASGAGLFAFGVLVGWAVTADRAEAKLREAEEDYKKVLRKKDKKIEKVSAQYQVLYDDLPTKDEAIQEIYGDIQGTTASETANRGLLDIQIVEDPETSDDESSVPEGETEEETRTNLQNLIHHYTETPKDVDTFVHRGVQIIEMELDNTPPFVISREKYAWDEEEGDEYSKITITYFPGSRILLDDDQDPIEDVESTVGWRNLNQFGGDSGDPDVVFIRNRRLLVDFEVVREEESELPLHIKYGMPKAEFETNKAAGLIKFRTEDV